MSTSDPFDLGAFDDEPPPVPVQKPGGIAARASAAGPPPYLATLNPDQRAASYHPIILDDIAMMEDSEDYYSNSGVFDALVLKIER